MTTPKQSGSTTTAGARGRPPGAAGLCRSAVVVLSALLLSCARDRPVNYAAYERIPNRPASFTFRLLAKSNPITARELFYGRYGGPGNVGGEPVDAMDELFRRHDIAYYRSKTRRTMLVADEELVERLGALDTSSLSPRGASYRDRVVRFFRSPVSHVIGKPWSTFYTFREPEGSYFRSPEVVSEFFSPEHPGNPAPRNELALRHTHPAARAR